MNYPSEMGSSGILLTHAHARTHTKFHMIGSGIQKMLGGERTHAHTQQGDLISLHLFQNKKSKLKTNLTEIRHESVTLFN
jgi:hypothetical protein